MVKARFCEFDGWSGVFHRSILGHSNRIVLGRSMDEGSKELDIRVDKSIRSVRVVWMQKLDTISPRNRIQLHRLCYSLLVATSQIDSNSPPRLALIFISYQPDKSRSPYKRSCSCRSRMILSHRLDSIFWTLTMEIPMLQHIVSRPRTHGQNTL